MTGKRQTAKTSVKGRGKDAPDRTENKGSKPGRKRFTQTVFKDWCKRCGICRAFCPKNVIGQDESGAPVFERPEDCIGCRFCELHCPDFAITVQEIEPEQAGETP